MRSLGVLVLLVLSALPAHAHDSRPLFVQIAERADDTFALTWVTPPTVDHGNRPTLSLACEPLALTPRAARPPRGSASYRCEGGTSGVVLRIHYPVYNPSLSTLIRVAWLSGETRTQLLPPGELSVALPSAETRQGVASQYLALGVDHILRGYDHLLFLACLLLIGRTWRRILITVTGFTLAHSVTLCLAALDLVELPVAAVEAAIALSIVFIATELVRARRDSLTWRHPIAVSTSFGLLHGFGFAAVLGEIGLPQTELPVALLFFNLGVEVGQLAFVAVCIVLADLLRRTWVSRPPPGGLRSAVVRPAGYAVGSLASFWLFERLMSFV